VKFSGVIERVFKVNKIKKRKILCFGFKVSGSRFQVSGWVLGLSMKFGVVQEQKG
jgi:hypothetical protein